MAELLGTHSYQLDPKGRVSLPARFREAFADGVWLTIGQDGCLYVFPRAEWQRRSDEVASSPLSDADGRAYSRLFFGSSDEAKLDSQGRVTIPQRLRETVGITQGRRGAGRAGPDGDLGPRELRALRSDPSPAHIRRERSIPGGRYRMATSPNKLGVEVRQSLSLIGMTALTLLASIGIGILAGHIG